MPDPKPRPNRKRYLEILRGMSGEQRLAKAFELSAFVRRLFEAGLRDRFPELPEPEFKQLVLRRLAKCHNRNS